MVKMPGQDAGVLAAEVFMQSRWRYEDLLGRCVAITSRCLSSAQTCLCAENHAAFQRREHDAQEGPILCRPQATITALTVKDSSGSNGHRAGQLATCDLGSSSAEPHGLVEETQDSDESGAAPTKPLTKVHVAVSSDTAVRSGQGLIAPSQDSNLPLRIQSWSLLARNGPSAGRS